MTRQNDRRLTTQKGWVKNGDRWIVTAIHADGSLTVRRGGGGGQVRLPADYVAENVEPAYATTAHRAQGRTVDTAHAIVSAASTREVLYVSATRGRESNKLYVDVAYDPDPASGHPGTDQQTPRSVLGGVLANGGAARRARRDPRLLGRRRGARAAARRVPDPRPTAQAERWEALIRNAGLDQRPSRPSPGL